MGMEAFAEAARLLAARLAGRRAVENVDFRAPFKFYRDEPRTLTITRAAARDGGDGTWSRTAALIGRAHAARRRASSRRATSPAASGWRASAPAAADDGRRRPTAARRR